MSAERLAVGAWWWRWTNESIKGLMPELRLAAMEVLMVSISFDATLMRG